MFSRDILLFESGVAVDVDNLHPVFQSDRDLVFVVCSSDEKDVAEVEFKVQEVIGESLVLLRIQNFKQRGRGISFVVGAEFVDLIQQEERVIDLDLLQ